MIDFIAEAVVDSLKLLPFLFLTYLLLEYLEHASSEKISQVLSKSNRYGPAVGALFGCVPQCGFSVSAANLYSGRVITLGTLIAVFVSTSDEAIPVLLSSPGSLPVILKLILVKFILAMFVGFFIDLIFKKTDSSIGNPEEIHKLCSHCHCEDGILRSACRHTFSIFGFILLVSLLLNGAIYFIGEENISRLLMNGSIFQPVVAAILGFIPNCASSVFLTELYLAGNLSFGSIVAGLSTGAGVGLAVLFRVNHNQKENWKIVAILFVIGVVFGMAIDMIMRG